MQDKILEINNLNVTYKTSDYSTEAIRNINFSLSRGERLGLVGESGSGKTTTSLAIIGLLSKFAEVSGQIVFDATDLLSLSEKDLNAYRWKRIAIVFQNGSDVLNPLLTVYQQIAEPIEQHMNLKKDEVKARVMRLLEDVGLDASWADAYPHQLSGGMRQRVLVAMALSCEPELLIVDEPTTALDAVAKQEIIDLIDRVQRENELTMIVSSHELGTIQKLTDRTMVLYRGSIMELGDTDSVIFNSMHPYSRGLVNSSTQINEHRDLWGIPNGKKSKSKGGCPFFGRCTQSVPECERMLPEPSPVHVGSGHLVSCIRGGIITVLEGENICKNYRVGRKVIEACKNVSISIRSGEIVSLIGESGSGKSTVANIIAGMLSRDAGNVSFLGREMQDFSAVRVFNGVQIVFQDSFSSIDDNFEIYQAIEEPLQLLKLGTKEERKENVLQALRDVQLPTAEGFIKKRCFMLSGGQRQRVAIARSLVMQPKLLIADEISSMLDPSTQANILRLLKGLQNSKGFSMLYITHDISLARKISDMVYVMKNGEIVEKGSALDVFRYPREPYTKMLIEASLYNKGAVQ